MKRQQCSIACAWMAVVMGSLAVSETAVWADTVQAQQGSVQSESRCVTSLQPATSREGLQGIQLETSDMAPYELFFVKVLHAKEVQRIDHPQIDLLRGYCYRNVLIVVRQDVKTPRPTGWVQVNFSVADVGALQQEVEQALRESDVAKLDDAERAKVIRLRLKADVPRNNCRVARLEVSGPEGFMIGFDQLKGGSCKTEETQTQSKSGEHDRPHHQ